MVIAEILLLSDPQYSVTIGSENYFSLTVAGVLGLVFMFIFFAIKFSYGLSFKGEKISLGKAATKSLKKELDLVDGSTN